MAFNEFQIQELSKIEGFGKAYEKGEKLGAKVMGDVALIMVPGAGTFKLAQSGGKLTAAAMNFVRNIRKAYPKAKINNAPTAKQISNAKPMSSAPTPAATSRVRAERKPVKAETPSVKATRPAVKAAPKPLKPDTKVVKKPASKPAAKKPVSKKKQAAAAAGAATTAAVVLAGIEKAKKAKQTTVGATPDKAKDQAAQKRVRPTRPKPPGSQRDKVRPTRPKPPGSQKDNKFLAEPTPKKSQAKKAPAKKPVDPQAQQYRPGRATEEPLRAFGGRYDPKTEVLRNVMRNGKKKTMVFRKKK